VTITDAAKKAKQLEYQREWARKNPEKRRAAVYKHHLKKAYGLSEAQYTDMLLAQAGRCAICGRKGFLVVDHCHLSKRVRELLCRPCNTMLGQANDSRERLKRAIAYLDRNEPV
jgi:hypothetical protein